MPELPEVEVTRRTLAERLCGAQVIELVLGKPLRWPVGLAVQALAGLRAGMMIRRGKYLWLPLHADHGPLQGGLLWHLGMSGSLRLHEGEAPPRGHHDHADLRTTHGVLRLTDPRRFGAVVWSSGLDVPPASKLLEHLGLEPLLPSFDGRSLHEGLQQRRAPIKQVLLAGDVVVGCGQHLRLRSPVQGRHRSPQTGVQPGPTAMCPARAVPS